MSLEQPLVPVFMQSGPTTGSATFSYKLAGGHYHLIDASIDTTAPYAQKAVIAYLDDQAHTHTLVTGWSMNGHSCCLDRLVEIIGPATIYASIYFDANRTATFTFTYRKVVP